jgi:hypothetical protein
LASMWSDRSGCRYVATTPTVQTTIQVRKRQPGVVDSLPGGKEAMRFGLAPVFPLRSPRCSPDLTTHLKCDTIYLHNTDNWY